jgi:hypothetical protein
MIRRLFLSLLLVISLSHAADTPENRVWKTVRGQMIEGSFQSMDGDNVVIQRKNSRQTVKVPKEELMPVDALYLDELSKKSTPAAPATPETKPKSGPASPAVTPDAIPLPGGDDEEDIPGEPSKGRLYPRTKDEVRAGLRAILGRDKPKELQREVHDAICRLNAYRFLSGLYSEVGSEKSMNDNAQDASKACAEAGRISHSLGHSTDRCNLSMGHHDMVSTVDGYIGDGGDNNREKRGHRRWCLNPPMKNAGFGREGVFSAMWCMDGGGTKAREPWSYPGRGLFPMEYVRGNAWSFYYTGSLPSETTVKMWKLTARPAHMLAWTEEPKGREIAIDYTHVYDNTINWEPATKGKRGIYWVRIHGKQVREQYVVELFGR